MGKRVTNLLVALTIILSLVVPAPVMAAQIGKTSGTECSCLQETERIKEQIKSENKVKILKTDMLRFEGQHQLRNRVSKNEGFWDILRNNVSQKIWESKLKKLKDKKSVFLFEVTSETKRVLIFKCEGCDTVYILPSPFKTDNGSDSGSNGNNSGNSGSNTGNNGGNSEIGGNGSQTGGSDTGNENEGNGENGSGNENSGNNGNSSGTGGDDTGNGGTTENPEKPDPEKPELKKIDTSTWEFTELKFVYDGNVHRPVLTGVPKELQKELNFVWSTNGETNAGNHSATLTVEVPSGYEPIPDIKVDFTIEEAEYDPSQVTWDKTSFAYNGEGQAPKPVGLPIDAEILSSTEAKVDAGEKYHHEVKVKIPNYKEFTASTEYDIKPVELSPKHQYNQETGEVITVIEGLVNEEDVEKLVNFVNGSEQDNIKIVEPGNYQVKTEVVLDTSKKDNYTSTTENLVAENNYLAKRSVSCYKITMEQIKNDDGSVQIQIYLSDVRIPFDKDEDAIVLAFDVSYDKNSLQYGYDDDDFIFGSNEWEGEYNPDRDPSDNEGVEEHDVSMLFYGALPTEKTLVCTLGYQIIGESENVEFSIINPEWVSGMSEHEFSYTTDSEQIVINKTDDYIDPEVIEINWDLQKDATYQGTDDEEAAREALQEYIDEELSTVSTSAEIIEEQENVFSEQEEKATEETESKETQFSEDILEQEETTLKNEEKEEEENGEVSDKEDISSRQEDEEEQSDEEELPELEQESAPETAEGEKEDKKEETS